MYNDFTESVFPLKSSEIFDVETGKWQKSADMPTELKQGHMLLFENKDTKSKLFSNDEVLLAW